MSPEISAVARAFITEYIEEHGSISKAAYQASAKRKALGLPDDGTIYRTFDSWGQFIEWCGIPYQRKAHRKPMREEDEKANIKRIDAMLEKGRIDYESTYDFRGMPACRRYTERYVDLDTGQTHKRMVTVLR
jgi:hypothetical protein